MRFGLIGDVHAEDERLRVAVETLVRENVDRLLCSGNLVDGQGDVDRTCALVTERSVVTVRGNRDRWIRDDEQRSVPHAHRMTQLTPESIGVLKSLPPTLSLDVPGGRLLLCHAVGPDDTQKLRQDDSGYALSTNRALMDVLLDPAITLMVCGHTGVPFVRRFERGSGKPPLVVVNAGTLLRDQNPGFALLDTVARRVDFYGIDDELRARTRSRAFI